MQTRILHCFLLFSLVFIGLTFLFGQNQQPVSDPQALTLVSSSVTALTGANNITDVRLVGTATWNVASLSETADATLMAKGTGESRFDMTLAAGPRSEIRNDASAGSLGELVAPDGSVIPWGIQNCLVNAVWFFPHLSVLGVSGDSSLVFSYVGQESRNGVAVQHIQSYRYIPGATPEATALNQQFSTMDVYLDATSFLPTAFVFKIHVADGDGPDLTVEVDFSNYQSLNGIQVPFRVQRYVAGSLGLDFSVASVQLNAGLPDGLFAAQ